MSHPLINPFGNRSKKNIQASILQNCGKSAPPQESGAR